MKQPTFNGKELLPLSVMELPTLGTQWLWNECCGIMRAT